MLNIAVGLGIIGVGALVTSFIFNELTEEEKQKQADIKKSYESYTKGQKEKLDSILKTYNINKEEFMKSTDEKIAKVRADYLNKNREVVAEFIESIENLITEQIQAKQGIREEINQALNRMKNLKENGTTFLRNEAMETLERELDEAKNKAYGYESYLKSYKSSYLRPYKRGWKDVDENFKIFSFTLPENAPYVGKLLLLEKEKLEEQEFKLDISDDLYADYDFDEMDIIEDFDNEAEIPVLISSCTFVKEEFKMKYSLSASKGLFKSNAIDQSRVGVEAKVKEHAVLQNGASVILLDYNGLELKLYRRNLENPKRTPPCGASLRVYPYKWDYALKYGILVTEKYVDSIKSYQFSSLPVVFEDDDGYDFINYVKENKIDFSNNEWKIGPLDENEIPNVLSYKYQFGNDIVFSAILSGTNDKPYFKFQKILELSKVFKPDDIFTVMEATLSLCNEDELSEFDDSDYRNSSELLIMLLNEFKTQKLLKTSQNGIAYFNKWSEIYDKLINYLEKGDIMTCEIDGFNWCRKDRKSGLPIYSANVLNSDEIRNIMSKEEDNFYNTFFIEDSNKDRASVEFSTTCETIYMYGNHDELIDEKVLTVFKKSFPYPEIMQRNALSEFRSGRVANSKLKTAILDSSNIESEASGDTVTKFFNENLKNNLPQTTAVTRAIEEKNVFMIQGPPGTGKTTVIREIINQYVQKHPASRILVVSQANVAIDNVLKGIPKEYNKNMIRCGKEDKIDEQLKDISFELKYKNYIERINSKPDNQNTGLIKWKNIINKGTGKYNSVTGEILLKSHNIIGATCVGLAQKQVGLDRLKFDLVIIDEIGKALPGEILIPLNKAKKIIMIGDHKQLPPTVNQALYDKEKIELQDSSYCKDELFDKCLFENLYENCPSSNKAILKTQYRMPAVIGSMVSELFYDGQLENGQNTYNKKPIYFNKNLNILDTSNDKDFFERKEGQSPIFNLKEAELVLKVVRDIRKKVNTDKRIAIISPYRRQKNIIIEYLNKNNIDLAESNIAVNTIDAFQGEEAEIVIYCTTRAKKKTQYFSDLARLNVAFSRAKNELLIIGSLKYFESYGCDHILNKISKYIIKNGDVISEKLETEFYLELDKIKIPDDFLDTPPSREKVEKFKLMYKKYGKFDKAIPISSDNIIKKRYARYIAAKELNLDKILVKIEK